MTHPSPEEWMAWLYGESNRDAGRLLADHLKACAECQSQIAQWRQAMAGLSAWRLPPTKARETVVWRPLRWAAAALVLLAIGYLVALLTTYRPLDPAALRAVIEPAIRNDLAREMKKEWQATLAAEAERLQKSLRTELSSRLEQVTVQTSAASEARMYDMARTLARAYDAMRAEDQQMILTLLQRLDAARTADKEVLQNDLVTLAVLTGDEIERTRLQVARVLSAEPPGQTIQDETRGSDLPR